MSRYSRIHFKDGNVRVVDRTESVKEYEEYLGRRTDALGAVFYFHRFVEGPKGDVKWVYTFGSIRALIAFDAIAYIEDLNQEQPNYRQMGVVALSGLDEDPHPSSPNTPPS